MSHPSMSTTLPANFEGTNGDLLVQPRPNQAPQLTLSIYNEAGLAKLQSDLRDHAVAFNKVNRTDLILGAINMIQCSSLTLNVNAFMAAMFSVVPHAERHQITLALRELFNWVDINIPTSDLDAILAECRR